VFPDGFREVGAALDRRIVRDDDALAPGDSSDARDQTRGGHLALMASPCRQWGELEKGRLRIDQLVDALADQELSALPLGRHGRLGSALADLRQPLAQLLGQPPVMGGIRLE